MDKNQNNDCNSQKLVDSNGKTNMDLKETPKYSEDFDKKEREEEASENKKTKVTPSLDDNPMA